MKKDFYLGTAFDSMFLTFPCQDAPHKRTSCANLKIIKYSFDFDV